MDVFDRGTGRPVNIRTDGWTDGQMDGLFDRWTDILDSTGTSGFLYLVFCFIGAPQLKKSRERKGPNKFKKIIMKTNKN